MAYLFQNTPLDTEVWSAQTAVLTWGRAKVSATTDEEGNSTGVKVFGTGSANSIPIAASSIQVSYTRQLNPMYPLNQQGGKVKRCVIAGSPSGTLVIQSLYAPYAQGLDTFLTAVAEPCRYDSDVWIKLKPQGFGNCAQKINTELTMYGVILSTFGFNMQGGDTSVINMPLQFSFTNLEFNQSATNSSGLI